MTEQSKENAKILGAQNLLFQTQEECGELIKAIGKYNRTIGIGQRTDVKKEDALEQMINEIADVSICIEQLIYLLDVEDEVNAFRQKAFYKVSKRYEDVKTILEKFPGGISGKTI